ncbi:hypothetical protein SLE2022_020490 [Rubroshorea leprosula]
MDSPALQSVEDVQLTQQQNIAHSLHLHHKDNGTCPNQSHKLGVDPNACNNNNNDNNNHHVNGVEVVVQPVNSSPVAQSPSTKKGYGLKKWRRIKRPTSNKDIAAAAEDYSKALKRGLSGSTTPITSLHLSSDEIDQNTEDSGGPSNVFNNVPGLTAVDCGFTASASSLDSRFAFGAAATGSENSPEWSSNSKSSTAASAPKLRHGSPAVLGSAQENNRMKNLLAKNLGNSNQRVQLGKAVAESTKKHRGEGIKIEEENSPSSMESDSRSSYFVFMQGVSSATSNGKQGGRSVNCNGENSNEAYTSEQQLSEEVQTAYRNENVTENEELSQDGLDSSWKAKKGKSENHRGLPAHDPLVESILALQSVQEALEKEVNKFGEIGREPVSLHANSGNTSAPVDSIFSEICEPSLSDQLASKKIGENDLSTLENQVLTLTHKIESLESSLEEAKVVLELKDIRIVELEATINSSKSPKEESGRTAELQLEKLKEMELEFEGLFRQKFEAEIEYLALMRAVEKLRVSVIDQKRLFEERKSLVGEQVHVLRQLRDVENKDTVLKKQAEKLEKYCGDILGTEEILKMQTRVCKVTFCFFIQLTLLVLVFWLVVLQLYPDSGVVVPT